MTQKVGDNETREREKGRERKTHPLKEFTANSQRGEDITGPQAGSTLGN